MFAILTRIGKLAPMISISSTRWVSIETRKEKGESYSILADFFSAGEDPVFSQRIREDLPNPRVIP